MTQVCYGNITITDITDGVNANIWTTSTAPTTPNYTFTISNLTGSNDEPREGDIILQGVYRYTITSVGSTTVLAGSRQSLQGATGAAGGKWYSGIGITGTNTTEQIFSGSGVASAVVGDMYLNTSTSNVYQCTTAGNASTAKWKYVNNIQGDPGASVVSTRELYYLTTGTAPDKPDDLTTIYTDNRINAWTSMVPAYIANGNYYITLETTLSDNTKKWSDVVLDKALTDSNYNINALNVRTKNFFKGTDNTYDGWFVSGRSTNEGLNTSNAETYYYNARLAATHISLGYNKTPVIDLDGSNAAINLYRFPTISNNVVTTEGTLGMQLNSTNLNFYNTSGILTSSFGNSISLASNGANITIGATGADNSNLYATSSSLQLRRGTTPNATLDSDGLKLSKGGIEAGTKNTIDYIYVWSHDEAINHTLTINNHEASDWRIIAGNKFGVDKGGNLYASSAVISGQITATALTIANDATITGLSSPTLSIDVEYKDTTVIYKAKLLINGKDVTETYLPKNYIWTYKKENDLQFIGTGYTITVLKDDIGYGKTVQLTFSDETISDSTPYILRATAGGASNIGNRVYESIVGGTVAWNQLEQFNRVSGSQSGVTYTNNNDGTFTLNGTATENNAIFPSNTGTSTPVINGHKYLAISNISNPSTSSIAIGVYVGVSSKLMTGTSHLIYAPTSESGNIQIGFRVASGMAFSNMKVTGGLTDLTLMFGSTIADYIYSLEQATAGSGIAKLKSWGFFTEDYYPYDSGSLKSVESLVSHDMVGFNQWDEEWEVGTINTSGADVTATDRIRSKSYIQCFPNTSYYAKTPVGLNFRFYDANKTIISYSTYTNITFTTPANCHYMRFASSSGYTAYTNDICINLSDTSKNGTYEPYEKHSYALDSTIVLRGKPTLVNGELVYDGDRYGADGSVTRKYGIVDLGTLNYSRQAGSDDVYVFTTAGLSLKKTGVTNIISDIFATTDITSWGSRKPNNSICGSASSTTTVIRADAYSDVTSLKAFLSGHYVVYEFATPATETADPYQSPQLVDKYGTEEYVTTGIVPVGHISEYY